MCGTGTAFTFIIVYINIVVMKLKINAKEKYIKNRTSLERLVYLLMSFLFQKIKLKHGYVLNIKHH